MVLMVLAVVARGAGGRENSDEDEGAEDARAGHELLRPPIVYGVRHTMIRASIPEGAMRNVMAFVALGIAVMASPVAAEEPRPAAPAAGELTALVRDFLAGVSRNDASVHERFWADDLVYTRAAGERVGKADILRDVRSSTPASPAPPTMQYAAEDMRIQQYGDTAIVAFRLVGTMGAEPPQSFLNTGTFVKRGGRWQAVAWQATRMAAPAPAPPKPDMGEFFLVLLKKGPAWTAERNDRTKAIQEGHMANIR